MNLVSKIFKEIDRALDRRLGIDDPNVRSGIIIGAGAIAGGFAGGALAGGAVGGIGATAGAATTAAIGTGVVTGAALAGQALAGGRQALSESTIGPGVKPPSSFGGDILGSQDRLRRSLANKTSVRGTNKTGGIRGSSSTIRPTLMLL